MTDAVSGRAGTAGDEAAGDDGGASGERPARPRILADTGALVWLPRRSRREITAGADGLRYLSVHRRKPGLRVARRP